MVEQEQCFVVMPFGVKPKNDGTGETYDFDKVYRVLIQRAIHIDIALSRVITYRYDGKHMDWDEVERIVPQLQAAIEEAKRGSPDSPVNGFLESVLSPSALKKDEISGDEDRKKESDLDVYQK